MKHLPVHSVHRRAVKGNCHILFCTCDFVYSCYLKIHSKNKTALFLPNLCYWLAWLRERTDLMSGSRQNMRPHAALLAAVCRGRESRCMKIHMHRALVFIKNFPKDFNVVLLFREGDKVHMSMSMNINQIYDTVLSYITIYGWISWNHNQKKWKKRKRNLKEKEVYF